MFKIKSLSLFTGVLILMTVSGIKSSSAQQHGKSTTIEKVSEDDKLVWLDWNEGYEKAVKSGKIVLVDAYTDWCGWCKRMDRDTYSNVDVIRKINAHFVPIKFNPELSDKTYKIGDQTFTGIQLYAMLTQGNSTGFPTTYYIYPVKKKIRLDAGYKGPQAFLSILDSAIEEGKK